MEQRLKCMELRIRFAEEVNDVKPVSMSPKFYIQFLPSLVDLPADKTVDLSIYSTKESGSGDYF